MSKNLDITLLLDFYGDMLTDKQRSFLSLYYNDDLSLSEIAADEGITRQGVRDALKKGGAELLQFEEKLGFMKKSGRLQALTEAVTTVAERLADNELTELAARLAAEF